MLGSINKIKTGVAILISDKINFKAKCIIRDSHYIMTKRTNHQEDKIILNLYLPNNMVTSMYKEQCLKKKFDKYTIIQLPCLGQK